jgi:hypothetical protein
MQSSLIDYAHWILGQEIKTLHPVEIYNGGSFATMILHREKPYQAELAIMWPFVEGFGNHRHPNINAYECFLYGDIPFVVNGKRVTESVKEFLPRLVIKVDATDWHTVDTMPMGGSFLSIQEWRNDKMTSVCMDWEGLPISKEQNRMLHDKKATWKRTTRKQMKGVSDGK